MNHLIRFAAMLVALALIAYSPAEAASDKEGDWAGGWTTWKTSQVGDWAEYALSNGEISRRDEVTAVNGGKVTFVQKTFKGTEETSSKEIKDKRWSDIRLTLRPYGARLEITWSEETIKVGEVELKCDVAKWKIGPAETTAYYCKDVPCGGFVKSVNAEEGGAARDTVWLTGFKTAKAGEVKGDAPVKPEAPKTEMPRFYATEGNSTVIKITTTGKTPTYQLREILKVEEKQSKFRVVACDESGTPDSAAKAIERDQTKAAWDTTYAKPGEQGVKLKVAAGEFVCDVYKSSADGQETTEWVCEGALVKKVTKSGATETTLEAIKITMK